MNKFLIFILMFLLISCGEESITVNVEDCEKIDINIENRKDCYIAVQRYCSGYDNDGYPIHCMEEQVNRLNTDCDNTYDVDMQCKEDDDE